MKKTLWVLITFIFFSQLTHAQINWGDYSQSYLTDSIEKSSAVGIITTIRSANNSFWENNGGHDQFFAALNKDASFKKIRPKEMVYRATFDTAAVHFFLRGVNQYNAKDFEFRVIEYGGKIITPWTTVAQFTNQSVIKSSGFPQMGYLGKYKTALRKMLIVDIRKKGSENIIATSVVGWKAIKPVLVDIYTSSELNSFLNRLNRPWAVRESDKWKKKYPASQLDPATGMPKKLTLSSNDNNLIFYLKANIYKREQLEYELIKKKKTSIPWKINDFDNSFIWLNNLPPGDYTLKIRYSAQPDHIIEYQFAIEPLWYESDFFGFVLGILTAALIGILIFSVMIKRQKQKTKDELAKKNKAELELKAIYSQLNPHFVFNALSSIQGLINKQDIEGANSYLTDFARLMRESLNNSHKTEISLNEEQLMLTHYLNLEKLRFGFQYHIDIDKAINIYETNVPSLLLQPLVENAVKHGVSALQENGIVGIDISKDGHTMIISISDNGQGFKSHHKIDGFGLKLTQDRIKLLNELNKGQNILFEIVENYISGTSIRLTFKNWFL